MCNLGRQLPPLYRFDIGQQRLFMQPMRGAAELDRCDFQALAQCFVDLDAECRCCHFCVRIPVPYFKTPNTACRTRSLNAPRPEYRTEEHTSELQSLMRISYAVFCLKI